RMNVACVRHETRRQSDNSRTAFSAEHRAIRLDILSGVHVVSVAADGLADISSPAFEVPIEVEETDFETLREKSADRALASSARPDQPNFPGCAHVTSKDILLRSRQCLVIRGHARIA